MASLLDAASPPRLLLLLLVASGAVVGSALVLEHGFGLVPCELCLYERWPWYATVVIALVGVAAGGRGAGLVFGLAALAFAAGAALSFYHFGVEQHWFPGPTACTGSGGAASSVEALTQQLLNRQPVSCDEPAWRLGFVSLAFLDFLASLAFLGFALAALRRLAGGARAVHA